MYMDSDARPNKETSPSARTATVCTTFHRITLKPAGRNHSGRFPRFHYQRCVDVSYGVPLMMRVAWSIPFAGEMNEKQRFSALARPDH
jgi:hypothetical protein